MLCTTTAHNMQRSSSRLTRSRQLPPATTVRVYSSIRYKAREHKTGGIMPGALNSAHSSNALRAVLSFHRSKMLQWSIVWAASAQALAQDKTFPMPSGLFTTRLSNAGLEAVAAGQESTDDTITPTHYHTFHACSAPPGLHYTFSILALLCRAISADGRRTLLAASARNGCRSSCPSRRARGPVFCRPSRTR